MRHVIHTFADGYVLKEPIMNPFKKGDRIRIPAGTHVTRMGSAESGPLKRSMTVKVFSADNGYLLDPWHTTSGHTVAQPPQIGWAGSGGYWAYALLTDRVLRANGLEDADLSPNTNNLWVNRHHIERLQVEGDDE